MLADHARRVASRFDASYTEDLARLHRATGGAASTTPMIPGPRSDQRPDSRIAVIAHVFYPELLEQLSSGLGALPTGADVFVSVPNDEVREQAIARLRRLGLGRLEVRIVANRGRDIAPKYVAFADVYDEGYDLLLFLHTKRSLTADFGDDWRDQLFRSLVGSPETVNGIVELFDSDAALGVVAPGHHSRIGSTIGWDGNYREARRLARRADVVVHRWSPPDFPSGSMFWARPQALAPLTGLRLRLDEFPAEDGQVGVTIMHALERMVFVAAARAGFHSVMVAAPGAPAPLAAPARGASMAHSSGPALRVRAAAAALTAARSARSAVRSTAARVAARSARGTESLAGRPSRRSPPQQ